MNWFEVFDLKTGFPYVAAEITEEVLNLFGPGLTGSYGVGDYIVAPAEKNSTFRFFAKRHFATGFLTADSDGEHPLVPEQWHGLGYKPLSRQELPDPLIPAYFRGVRYGEPVESFGYCPRDKLVVYVQGEPIAVDSPAFPEDAIFAWRLFSDSDWKCSHCEVEIDDTNYGQLTEEGEDDA